MQSVVNLSLLQIEGLAVLEERRTVRCYLYMDGHLYGSVLFLNDEKPVTLPSEGVLSIEVKDEDQEVLIGHTTIDMNAVIGRSRVWVNLTSDSALSASDPLRLLLSAPSLPSIQESPETPLSEDDRATFSQLSSTAQHMKVIELQSVLDRERRAYLSNVEQFMTHHKAMQDRYQFTIDVLTAKLRKMTVVMEDMKAQIRSWGEIEDLWKKQEKNWKEKLREFSENATNAYRRFEDRENTCNITMTALETEKKTLEEEKAALSETVIKNESEIFELTETIKELHLHLLQVQSTSGDSLAKKYAQAQDTISTLSQEIEKLKRVQTFRTSEVVRPKLKEDSRIRVKPSNLFVSDHKEPSASKTEGKTAVTRWKKDKLEQVAGSHKEKIMTLSSTNGVLIVHTEDREIPLSEFLRMHHLYPTPNHSSASSPTGRKSVVSSSLTSSPVLRKSAVIGPEMRLRKRSGTDTRQEVEYDASHPMNGRVRKPGKMNEAEINISGEEKKQRTREK